MRSLTFAGIEAQIVIEHFDIDKRSDGSQTTCVSVFADRVEQCSGYDPFTPLVFGSRRFAIKTNTHTRKVSK